MSYRNAIAGMPAISDGKRRELLAPPAGPVRVVIDTDAKNEIDDQFAITWALLSQDQLQIEGMYAVPFSFQRYRQDLMQAYALRRAAVPVSPEEAALLSRYADWLEALEAAGQTPDDMAFNGPDAGMEQSYQEILTVYEKVGADPDGQVLRGSNRFLSSAADPVQSPAAQHLIERAMQDRHRPLYVVAIGAVTNVVSALLLEPRILDRIVVIWTASYPSVSPVATHSFNLWNRICWLHSSCSTAAYPWFICPVIKWVLSCRSHCPTWKPGCAVRVPSEIISIPSTHTTRCIFRVGRETILAGPGPFGILLISPGS